MEEKNACLDSAQIGEYEIFIPLLGNDEAVVDVGLHWWIFDLLHHKQYGEIVDNKQIQCLFLLRIFLNLQSLNLFILLIAGEYLSIGKLDITNIIFLLFIKSFKLYFEYVLVKFTKGILLAYETQLTEDDSFEVVLFK